MRCIRLFLVWYLYYCAMFQGHIYWCLKLVIVICFFKIFLCHNVIGNIQVCRFLGFFFIFNECLFVSGLGHGIRSASACTVQDRLSRTCPVSCSLRHAGFIGIPVINAAGLSTCLDHAQIIIYSCFVNYLCTQGCKIKNKNIKKYSNQTLLVFIFYCTHCQTTNPISLSKW